MSLFSLRPYNEILFGTGLPRGCDLPADLAFTPSRGQGVAMSVPLTRSPAWAVIAEYLSRDSSDDDGIFGRVFRDVTQAPLWGPDAAAAVNESGGRPDDYWAVHGFLLKVTGDWSIQSVIDEGLPMVAGTTRADVAMEMCSVLSLLHFVADFAKDRLDIAPRGPNGSFLDAFFAHANGGGYGDARRSTVLKFRGPRPPASPTAFAGQQGGNWIKIRPSWLIRPGSAPRLGFARFRGITPSIQSMDNPSVFAVSSPICREFDVRDQLIRVSEIVRVMAHELSHEVFTRTFAMASGGGSNKQYAGPDFRTYSISGDGPNQEILVAAEPLADLMSLPCRLRPKGHWICDWVGGVMAGLALAPIVAPLEITDSATALGIAIGLDDRHRRACSTASTDLFGPCGYGPRQSPFLIPDCPGSPTNVAGACC